MKLALKCISTTFAGLSFWALASPATVRFKTMAPEPAMSIFNQIDDSDTFNSASRILANNDFDTNQALYSDEVRPSNYQVSSTSPELYSNADIKSIIASNQSLAKELQTLRQQNQNQQQQPKPIFDVDPSKRDAARTDILADAAFSEAATSRSASSIAKEKGLALIPALRTIELRLLTAVNTEQGGKFKALVTTDVWDAGFANVGIPAGTLARGTIESGVNDGDTRIHMTITEFILPSGDLVQLRVADGVTDSHGASGPKGKVNNKWLTRLGSTVVCGVLGAASSLGSNRQYSTDKHNSNNNAPLSLNVAIRQNLAGEFGAQSARSFERGMQSKPTIELREGATIAMILGSSIYLVPWERLRITISAPNQRLVH